MDNIINTLEIKKEPTVTLLREVTSLSGSGFTISNVNFRDYDFIKFYIPNYYTASQHTYDTCCIYDCNANSQTTDNFNIGTEEKCRKVIFNISSIVVGNCYQKSESVINNWSYPYKIEGLKY